MRDLINNIIKRTKSSNDQSNMENESIRKWYKKLAIISGAVGGAMLPFMPHFGIALMGTFLGSLVSYYSNNRISKREEKRIDDEVDHLNGLQNMSFRVNEEAMNDRMRRLRSLKASVETQEEDVNKSKNIDKGLLFATMLSTAVGMITGLPVAWLSTGLAGIQFFKGKNTFDKVDNLEETKTEYDNLKNDIEIIQSARSARQRQPRRTPVRTNQNGMSNQRNINNTRRPRPVQQGTTSQRGINRHYTAEQNRVADAYINALANMNKSDKKSANQKVKK